MEYAGSYALFNYRLEEPTLGLKYDNLRLIRAFEHGLDPLSSEAGFVLVHIDMVKDSGELVGGAVNALEAAGKGDTGEFNNGMEKVVEALININGVMESELLSPDPPLSRRLTAPSHVEKVEAWRLYQLPHVHFRHH